MTLQIFRNPVSPGSSTSRRDNLALGSLFNPGPVAELKLPQSSAKAPETAGELLQMLTRRTKIWELNASLHCSIIGTCLSTADLRQVLGKLNVATAQTLSDHDLHKHGVSLAAQRDGSAKLLQKALDRKHQRAVGQFDRAKNDADLGALWDEAVQRGEIPGAYWALLSHPLSSEALVKRAFGEVHMLSHLVGTANRADIRRLSALEAENAELQDKIRRQQEQIHALTQARDAKISDLNTLLSRALAERGTAPVESATVDVTATLERRLSSETSHRQRVEERLRAADEKVQQERTRREKAEQQATLLQEELMIVEAALDEAAVADMPEETALQDQAVLYVGGQSGHVAGLRDVAARFAARLLHHDGGVEDSGAQLAGLISQAEMVFFPVDFISHDAMQAVKRLSRQAGKPYIPLRSAGLTSFLVALRTAADARSREHAIPGF